jgi:hypothetical protein
METMRRLILSLSSLGLLAAVVGCNHTAGVCDCDPHHNPIPPGTHLAPVPAALPAGPVAAPAPMPGGPAPIVPPGK